MSRKDILRNNFSFSNNSDENFDYIGLDSESEKFIEKFVNSKESFIQNYKASKSYYEEIDEYAFSLEAIVDTISFEDEIISGLKNLRNSKDRNTRLIYLDITKRMGVEANSNEYKKQTLGDKIKNVLKEMFIRLKNMISNIIAAFKKLFRNIASRGDKRVALIMEKKNQIMQKVKTPGIKNIILNLPRAYKSNKFLSCDYNFITSGFKSLKSALIESDKHIKRTITIENKVLSNSGLVLGGKALLTVGTAAIAGGAAFGKVKLGPEKIKIQDKDGAIKTGIKTFRNNFSAISPILKFMFGVGRLKGGMMKKYTGGGKFSGSEAANSIFYGTAKPKPKEVSLLGIVTSVPFEVLSNSYTSDLEASCDTLQYLVMNCNASLDLLNKISESKKKVYRRTHKALTMLRSDMQTISSLSRELLKEGLYVRQTMIRACNSILEN